jgi:hypothetical protein
VLTTRIYNLQKENPRTFAVMLTKRQRRKVSAYLKDFEQDFCPENGEVYSNISKKLLKGHMSYSDSELNIMRAAITLNRFIEPLSFMCKRYVLYTNRA